MSSPLPVLTFSRRIEGKAILTPQTVKRWAPMRLVNNKNAPRGPVVGGVLARASALRVGSGVGGAAVASGSSARPSHSCDWRVCGLGVVGVSLVFGLVRGAGVFPAVLPTLVWFSRLQLA